MRRETLALCMSIEFVFELPMSIMAFKSPAEGLW